MNDDQLADGIRRAFQADTARYRDPSTNQSRQRRCCAPVAAALRGGARSAASRWWEWARRSFSRWCSRSGRRRQGRVPRSGPAGSPCPPSRIWRCGTTPGSVLLKATGVEPNGGPGSSLTYGALPLVVQDQRGSVALFFFGRDTAAVDCAMWRDELAVQKRSRLDTWPTNGSWTGDRHGGMDPFGVQRGLGDRRRSPPSWANHRDACGHPPRRRENR